MEKLGFFKATALNDQTIGRSALQLAEELVEIDGVENVRANEACLWAKANQHTRLKCTGDIVSEDVKFKIRNVGCRIKSMKYSVHSRADYERSGKMTG
jgi:hypothetical protein